MIEHILGLVHPLLRPRSSDGAPRPTLHGDGRLKGAARRCAEPRRSSRRAEASTTVQAESRQDDAEKHGWLVMEGHVAVRRFRNMRLGGRGLCAVQTRHTDSWTREHPVARHRITVASTVARASVVLYHHRTHKCVASSRPPSALSLSFPSSAHGQVCLPLRVSLACGCEDALEAGRGGSGWRVGGNSLLALPRCQQLCSSGCTVVKLYRSGSYQ